MTSESELQLNIPIETIKRDVVSAIEENIKNHLMTLASSQVHSDYTLGIYIKDVIDKYIKDNLSSIVLSELESVNIKAKVEKAVERATLDIVRNQLKKMNI